MDHGARKMGFGKSGEDIFALTAFVYSVSGVRERRDPHFPNGAAGCRAREPAGPNGRCKTRRG